MHGFLFIALACLGVGLGAKVLTGDASAPVAPVDDPARAEPPNQNAPPPGAPPAPPAPPPPAAQGETGVVLVGNTDTLGGATFSANGTVVPYPPARWLDAAYTRLFVPTPSGSVVIRVAKGGVTRAKTVTVPANAMVDVPFGDLVIEAPAGARSGGGGSATIVGALVGAIGLAVALPRRMTVRYEPGAYFRTIADGRGGTSALAGPLVLQIRRGPNATAIEPVSDFVLTDPGFSNFGARPSEATFNGFSVPEKYAYRSRNAQSAILTPTGDAVEASIFSEPRGNVVGFTVTSLAGRVTIRNERTAAYEADVGVIVYKAKPNELVITAPPPDGMDVETSEFALTALPVNESKTFTLATSAGATPRRASGPQQDFTGVGNTFTLNL